MSGPLIPLITEAAQFRSDRDAAEASLQRVTAERDEARAEPARLQAEGEAKDRRIAALTEALVPFADAAGLFGPPATGRECTIVDAEHLRAARAATAREG